MKTNNILSFTVLATLLAAGCSKTEVEPQSWRTDPDAVIVDASVGTLTRSNPLGDESEQSTFNVGDEITITQPDAGSSVIYKFDGTSWSPSGGDYLVWSDKGMNFVAWYPTKDPSLVTDQSTLEGIAKADVMYCMTGFGAIPSDHRLRLSLGRQCALVTVRIKGYNDEFDPATDKITDMRIYLSDLDKNQDHAVKPYVRDASGAGQSSDAAGAVGFSYSAIGLRATDSESDLFIEFKVGGKTMTVSGCPSLDFGKAYTFNLTVGKARIEAGDVTVSDWSDPVDLNGGNEFEAGIDGEVWDGTVATSFESGTGTEADPYIIATPAQLAYLAQQVNNGERYSGKYFKLTSNIFFENLPWTPIGNGSSPFSGRFDGGGKRVFMLNVNDNSSYAGLFGHVNLGSVKNVVIESANIVCSSDAAVLCGWAQGAVIENCSVRGNVEGSGSCVGGLVGWGKSSNIKGCTAEVTVKGDAFIGGICGQVNSGSTVSGCSLINSSVEGTDNFFGGVGGIAGKIENKQTVLEKCEVRGGTVKGKKYVGGLVGRVQYDGPKVADCSAYVDVRSEGIGGGLVGDLYDNSSTWLNCGFDGTITYTGSGTAWLGAAVGKDESAATFTNCWYNADKTGDLPLVAKIDKDAVDKDYSGIEPRHLGN